ncbi:MAG: DNA topoisomerase IV subunit B [Steroidobacteraceae bacterium]
MSQSYTAQDIEVLSGLEPVRRRPGMYTDTSRPNHLAHEVIDNSVDEALAGHCSRIDVTVYKDGSLEVVDDGRGMPVDIHPKEKVSGVELILTRLHAGGKFSADSGYKFSGGLHGVGVSVVNALSAHLECWVRRGGKEYNISFKNGKVHSKLEVVGEVGARSTGTTVRFWPDTSFFDSPDFAIPKLKHVLKAKAVLCPGLKVRFLHEKTGEKEEWLYTEGLGQYLRESLEAGEFLPDEPYTGAVQGEVEGVDWAVVWRTDDSARFEESYVNLIPTAQGGTHVNGFRLGLTEAVREFCEFRNLLPRGLKLAPEDVWDDTSYVLSMKMRDPQFAGQTKERLSSREPAAFVSGIVKDQLGLWLAQHPEQGERIAQLAIGNAQTRLKASQKVARKRVVSGPALPGKLADCTSQDPKRAELFLVEGDSAGGSAKQARDREFQAVMPLRGKILNTWEVDAGEVLSSQEVHDITVAIGVDPGAADISNLRYGKICILADADSDGMHIATLLCALFLRHFRPLVLAGHVHVAMPPLYRIDFGKNVEYALDDAERNGILERIRAENPRTRPVVTRFKGLGEMNPLQLRETTMAKETRRLVQLTVDAQDRADQVMDMLLAKKRASDRREWLETKGNLASAVAPVEGGAPGDGNE